MVHIMFMFLGAGRLAGAAANASAANAATASYQRTTYEFPSKERHEESLFGLALLKEMASKSPVDKLVVLGTSGSAWDNLITETGGSCPSLAQLNAAQAADAVTSDMLRPYFGLVQDNIKRKGWAQEVVLEIIPYGFEKAEQISLIEMLARHVNEGDQIVFDVTNGLRHFPLMGVQAAIVVKRLRNAEIAGIWYGAYDHPRRRLEGIAPAVRLDGFAHLTDWLETLGAFDADGNYARFSRLLKDDGASPRTAETLRVAGFREHVGDLAGAADKLLAFRAAANEESISGGARLFLPALLARTAWAEGDHAYWHYRELALASLEAEDLVRTARFAYEAALTRITMHFGGGGDIVDGNKRSKAREAFTKTGDTTFQAGVTAFKELSELRNALVHGSYVIPVSPATKTALSDVKPCRRFLEERIAYLLPEDPMHPF